jgi:alpha-1,3(6)-mannosylglycoprotein beta-1,6-N-acetyl-glucosaminyltransferase
VLLDNIMLRLGKLESKVDNIYNGTGGNLTNGTGAVTAAPSATNAEKVNVAGGCHFSSSLCFVVLVCYLKISK